MFFGQNLLDWFLVSAKALATLGLIIGVLFFLFKRETTKLIVFAILAIIVVVCIWNPDGIINFFLNVGNTVIGN